MATNPPIIGEDGTLFWDGMDGAVHRYNLNSMVEIWELALEEAVGAQGWSPILGGVSDGARRVLQIVDWTGGEGTKPTLTGYVGPSGIVPTIGQATDIRGGSGEDGTNGWTAVSAVVNDGARRVLQVSDWTGGTGSKPAAGQYIGPAGFVSDIAEAVDIRGSSGDNGWTPVLAAVSDGARRVHQVVDWVGGQGDKPATGRYIGSDGFVDDIEDAVNVRGGQGDQGDEGPANTLAIGTVEEGEEANATITGESPNQTLNLVLPKGDTGPVNTLAIGTVEDGEEADATITGESPNQTLNLVLPKGATGPANVLTIGTVQSGEGADAEITGDAPEQVLNLTLPKGDRGDDGEDGWSPVIATVSDGDRRVQRIDDWTGGTGDKPATGYIGPSGLTQNIAEATDIRGTPGSGSVSSVNNVSPDGSGNVDLEIEDIDGLEEALANAGQVKTVLGVFPDAEGDVELELNDIPGLEDALDGKVDKAEGYGLSQENYTPAEKSKLAALESSRFKGEYISLVALQSAHPTASAGDYADVDEGVGQDVARYIWDTTDSKWVKAAGESTQMTAAQVKTAYESNPDTNAFTDAEKTKLDGVAPGATANTGTVTSVQVSVPTGLSVAGGPITGSGTITVSYETGYAIPTTAKQGQWDSAFGWGNHAAAGYALTSSLAAVATSGSYDDLDDKPTIPAPVPIADTAAIASLSGSDMVTPGALGTAADFMGTISGGASPVFNWGTATKYAMLLTGNRTLPNPTNLVPGTTRVIQVASSTAAERTLTFGTWYVGNLPTVAVTNNRTMILFLYAYASGVILVSGVEV